MPGLNERMGLGWLTRQEPVISVKLPPDVHAELLKRSAHDGASIEERVAWLLTELVRRKRH